MALEAGRWEDSRIETQKWLEDQPFSSRPAIHGSFLAATVFEDFEETKRLARIGLRCNRDDKTLLNNLIVAAAMLGEQQVAEQHLKRLEGFDEIPLLATTGLVAFRRGEHQVGRACYQKSVEVARMRRDAQREAHALVHLALEELRLNSPYAQDALVEALEAAKRLHTPLGTVLANRVRNHRRPRQTDIVR